MAILPLFELSAQEATATQRRMTEEVAAEEPETWVTKNRHKYLTSITKPAPGRELTQAFAY
jgi:hypothetical protein